MKSIYLYKSLLVIVMGRVGNQNGSGGHTFCYGQKGSCNWGSFCSVRKPGWHWASLGPKSGKNWAQVGF